LWLKRYGWARILIVAVAASLLLTWGVSQFPYLIPPDVQVQNAASPQNTQALLLIGIIIALLIVVPSLWFMFYVFKVKKVAGVDVVAHHPPAEPAAE
jgi:cytochrome bd ubiquinol oxidase subunit II